MATGRIGVTPNLRTRWSKAPAGGTTSLSGLDDNSVSLVYDAGFEAVYRNGVLLSRGNDYTATNGTTITLVDATIAGDIIEVFANQAIPLTSTYTQAVADAKFINNSLVDAKGDIIAATAADTVARLAVGSNDQVLTADSSTNTGLKWATATDSTKIPLSTVTTNGDLIYGTGSSTVTRLGIGSSGQYLTVSGGVPAWGTLSAGGMTLLASGNTVNAASVITLSSIPTTYINLVLYMRDFRATASSAMNITFNNVSVGGAYAYQAIETNNTATVNAGVTSVIQSAPYQATSANSETILHIFDYTTTNSGKHFQLSHSQSTTGTYRWTVGYAKDTIISNAVTRIDIALSNFSGTQGTYALYGVK